MRNRCTFLDSPISGGPFFSPFLTFRATVYLSFFSSQVLLRTPNQLPPSLSLKLFLLRSAVPAHILIFLMLAGVRLLVKRVESLLFEEGSVFTLTPGPSAELVVPFWLALAFPIYLFFYLSCPGRRHLGPLFLEFLVSAAAIIVRHDLWPQQFS